MKNLLSQVSLSLVFILLVSSCCKEPVIPPFPENPCAGKKPVTADFKILEVLGPTQFLSAFKTETDNIIYNKNVIFEAVEEGAQYTWYIGEEVLNTKSFGRFFNTDWTGQTIPVTLVVEKEPNLTCFPSDPGRDSVTKFMQVFGACDYDNMPMNGTFRIAREMQTDSFDFSIQLYNNQHFQFTGCYTIDLLNVDGQGTDCISGTNMNIYTVHRNNRFLKKDWGPDLCFGFDMEAQLHLNGIFELTFKHYAGMFPNYETRKFWGRKLD